MLAKEPYSVVFVDFFDTVYMRHVTPMDVYRRWAFCLEKKFPSLMPDTIVHLPEKRIALFNKRRQELTNSGGKRTEPTYTEAIGDLYDRIQGELSDCTKEQFISTSKTIEMSVELGCGYANEFLIKELKEEKAKGKHIQLVSDFYFGAEDLKLLMFAAGIPADLFDEILVSCEVGVSKATGGLYSYALKKVFVPAAQVVMVGDNKMSDCNIPASMGLQTAFRPHLLHKCNTHIREAASADYARRQFKESLDEMYKSGMPYSEYIGIFYVFTKRLYHQLCSDGLKRIAFVAREGYYLQELFHTYQDIAVPDKRKIQTSYFWCSRRSIMSGIQSAHTPEGMGDPISIRNWLKSLDISVEEARQYADIRDDELDVPQKLSESTVYKRLMSVVSFKNLFEQIVQKNREAFTAYILSFLVDGKFCFVDSGWKCTQQNAIEYGYGIPTRGYYIGTQKPDKPIGKLDKTGLIFSEEEPRSRYYEYLGTNIPFYQQLLAAPHGTAIKYTVEDGNVHIKSEWDPMEKRLYEEKIQPLQQYMLLKFRGLCAWDDAAPFDAAQDWLIAKLSMRSSLFAHDERLAFIRECTDNYVQNFRQENRGKVQYDMSKVSISPGMIAKPDKLLRYVGKIQRTSLYDKKSVRAVYPAASRLYYAYTLGLQKVKNLSIAEEEAAKDDDR